MKWRDDLYPYQKRGDDRDRKQEQIIEAGLMPDDVIGVSGNFESNWETCSMLMTYISDGKSS